MKSRIRGYVEAALAPLIEDVVDTHRDRQVVVQDVLTCWYALPPAMRLRRGERERPEREVVEQFVSDYVERVDRAAYGDEVDPFDLSQAEADAISRGHWLLHIAEIRSRAAAGWGAEYALDEAAARPLASASGGGRRRRRR